MGLPTTTCIGFLKGIGDLHHGEKKAIVKPTSALNNMQPNNGTGRMQNQQVKEAYEKS